MQQISEALKSVKHPHEIDVEQVQRKIDAQYALIEQMQRWLDHYLKN